MICYKASIGSTTGTMAGSDCPDRQGTIEIPRSRTDRCLGRHRHPSRRLQTEADEHIVQPTATAVHGYSGPCVFDSFSELPDGELGALVGVEDLWNPATRQGLIQGIHAKIGLPGCGRLVLGLR